MEKKFDTIIQWVLKFTTHAPAIIAIAIRSIFAFISAWVIYMVVMMMTVYDGLLSLIFQPLMAALASAIVVAISLILYIAMKLTKIYKFWESLHLSPILLIACSVICVFSQNFGLNEMIINPETKENEIHILPAVAITCYQLVILSIFALPLSHITKILKIPFGNMKYSIK